MITFFIISGIFAIIALLIVVKLRKMPQYKISIEPNESGVKSWFVKVRKGFSYYYLNQVRDFPGFEDDLFETSKMQIGAQETEILAEKIIVNHRMTTVNGIQKVGE